MEVYERIESLRKEFGISQGKLEKELGFSNGSISKWKNSMPNPERLKKLADYFNVSVDFLMTGKEEDRLTEKDTRDIAKDLESIMKKLESGEDGPIRYNGQVIDDTSRILLRNAIELGLTQLKIENKELYNPYKNKK